MKFLCCCVLLVIGCDKAKAPINPTPAVATGAATAPTPVPMAPVAIPAAPAIRQRFHDGLEAFLTEARVITNLPSTGASSANIKDQQAKVEQAFARISDPQNALEKTLYAKAKQFTVDTWGIVNAVEVHHQALAYGDPGGKKDIDDTAKFLKEELKPIEDELDK